MACGLSWVPLAAKGPKACTRVLRASHAVQRGTGITNHSIKNPISLQFVPSFHPGFSSFTETIISMEFITSRPQLGLHRCGGLCCDVSQRYCTPGLSQMMPNIECDPDGLNAIHAHCTLHIVRSMYCGVAVISTIPRPTNYPATVSR